MATEHEVEPERTPRTSHTPGPWKIDPDDNDQVLDRTGHSAVHSGFCGMKLPREERVANARLIAAAPELLAVLRDTLPQLVRGYPSQQIDRSRAVAAIAKATD